MGKKIRVNLRLVLEYEPDPIDYDDDTSFDDMAKRDIEALKEAFSISDYTSDMDEEQVWSYEIID